MILVCAQGRCVWVNLTEKTENLLDEDAEEEEKEEEPDEPEPEVGPLLLTSLSEDAGESLTQRGCRVFVFLSKHAFMNML